MSKPTQIRNQSELRSEILNSLDLPLEDIHIPRWDKHVLVKGHPTAHPRYVAYVSKATNAREEAVRKTVGAAIMSTLDPETSEPLFNWSDEKDLRTKHYNSILLIAQKAFELAAGDGPIEMAAWDAIQFLIAYGRDEGHNWDQTTLDNLTDVALLVQKDIAVEEGVSPDDEPDEEPNRIEDAGDDVDFDDDVIEAEIVEEDEEPIVDEIEVEETTEETDEVASDGPLAG